MIDNNTDLGSWKNLYPINDEAGAISAYVTTLTQPFSTAKEWRTFLDQTLTAMVHSVEEWETMEGLYAISYWTDHDNDDRNTLQLTRMSHGEVASVIQESLILGFPDNTLGLLAVIHEPDSDLYTATLALQAGCHVGHEQIQSDQIFATAITASGEPVSDAIKEHNADTLRRFGELMIHAMDEELGTRLQIQRSIDA